VAALVHRIDDAGIGLRLVNTSVVHARTVRIRGGRFGADRIVRVSATAETRGVPGASGSYRAPANPARTTTWSCDDDLVVTLSPAHAADLDLIIARGAERPACTLPEETHERRPDPPRFRPARARGAYARPPRGLIDDFGGVSSATACAKLHGLGIRHSYIDGPEPLTAGSRVVGSALTLQFMPQREDMASGQGQEYAERHTRSGTCWRPCNRATCS
jgi:hypothetical protein